MPSKGQFREKEVSRWPGRIRYLNSIPLVLKTVTDDFEKKTCVFCPSSSLRHQISAPAMSMFTSLPLKIHRPDERRKGELNSNHFLWPLTTNHSFFDRLSFPSSGSNMSGKSTYLRMVALIQILAQSGCFVPASLAHLPLCHAIHSRILSRWAPRLIHYGPK